jgi:uncharacterized OB-fold protein
MFCPNCGSDNVNEVKDDDAIWELHTMTADDDMAEYCNNMIKHKCEECGYEFFIPDI